MRRRFTNQNINQLGYTDNTNTAYNNYNVIPSNNITMQNTSTPILGQGLDQYGNPITQPVVMQPGQNYQFQNATYVEETPQFQKGGSFRNRKLIKKAHNSEIMKDASQIPFDLLDVPQNVLMWGLTDKYQKPSQALKNAYPNSFTNHPLTQLATDVIVDPLNFLSLLKLGKVGLKGERVLSKSDKTIKKAIRTGSTVDNVGEVTEKFKNGGAYNVPTSYPPTPTFGNNFNQPQLNQWNSAYLSGQGQPPQLSYVEETPMYQGGGYYNDPRAYQMWQRFNNPQVPQNNQLDWASTNQMVQPNPNVGAYNVPTSYPPTPTFGNNFNQSFTPQTTGGLNQWNRAYLTGQGQPYQEQPTEVQQGMIDANYPETVAPETNPQLGRFQFYNPYGGYDVENASFQLGQGIESGNTLQTVGAGLKVLSGLGRNVSSGLGFQRQNEKVMDEYKRQQRNALTQNNRPQHMQEGGEVSQEQQLVEGVVQALQQGMQPEEVLQALIQQGLDEQTATQLIQAVMQQLQGQQPQQPMMKNGGQYLEKLKNKKIKNYTFNEKTGNYEVEVE